MPSSPKGKNTAIIAYCTIVGSLIATTMNLEPKHQFARFHTRQAFGIHLIFHALAFVFNSNGFFLAWQILTVCYLFLLVYRLFIVINNQMKPLPILGSYFQKWFTFIS